MIKLKVLSKGYTLKVVSWENDGDNYRTIYHTVESKEEALALKHMCENLFKGSCNGEGGVGNLCEGEYTEYDSVVGRYIPTNPGVLELLNPGLSPEELDDADVVHDIVSEANYALMGGSEYYMSRVCESVTAYYIDEDVYAEVV